MIDKETMRRMCEYEIKPSLIGEIEPVKETARERADRIWGMNVTRSQEGVTKKEPSQC
jgi:hypothetical protein